MRVVAFRRPQNPSPLPDLGAYARKHPCLRPITALRELPAFLGRSGRRGGHSRCPGPQFQRRDYMTSAYFSSSGKHVRGVPVCHIRSISPFCDTPPSPCRWWLSLLLRRYPLRRHYEGEDVDERAEVASSLVLLVLQISVTSLFLLRATPIDIVEGIVSLLPLIRSRGGLRCSIAGFE